MPDSSFAQAIQTSQSMSSSPEFSLRSKRSQAPPASRLHEVDDTVRDHHPEPSHPTSPGATRTWPTAFTAKRLRVPATWVRPVPVTSWSRRSWPESGFDGRRRRNCQHGHAGDRKDGLASLRDRVLGPMIGSARRTARTSSSTPPAFHNARPDLPCAAWPSRRRAATLAPSGQTSPPQKPTQWGRTD